MNSHPIIPGLVKEAYVAGSRHSVPSPDLTRSDVDGTSADFEWKAIGSDVYKVVAKGSVVIIGWSGDGRPRFDSESFHATCSCPDGARQRVESINSGKVYVCKHAEAALDSVLDSAAANEIESQRKARAAEATVVKNYHVAYQETQRKEQDAKFPGERKRIEHGLSKRSADEIMTLLKESVTTVDGLEALAKLFPKETMPAKTTTRCGRCKKEYDHNIPSDQICRIQHPCEKVDTEWNGSKKSWDHCRNCDKTFNLNGFHSWGRRGRNDPFDEGEYCYEDQHVPEVGYDAENDPTIQMLDESDY